MKVDFEAIKAATDIVRVIASYGVQFKKSGRDYIALCPFHMEQTPSFHVTPAKRLFHCFGCEAKGNVIQFVAMKEGLSEREAAVKLLGTVPGVTRGRSLQTATTPKKILKPGDAAMLLQRVVNFYVRTFAKDQAGLDYLKGRNLADATMLGTFQIGYSNGSLLKVLPREGDILDGLKTLGVIRADGREHFEGCVTVPIFDDRGNVCGIYGRRITNDEPKHLYLPGPHRGVWNGGSAKTNQTLLVAEAIFDGLALWQAGFRNVIAIYGAQGWTPDHEALFKSNPIREVLLCLDNDDAGRAGTERLKSELQGHQPPLVKAVHVIQWPEGVKDAAEFFLARAGQATSAADFEVLLKAAAPQPEPGREGAGARPPLGAGDACQITMTPTGFVAVYAGRRYECQAIEQPNPARLKATVKAVAPAGGGRCGSHFHIDTVDFYLSRHRRVFIGEVARLLSEKVEVIEADMNRLIGQLEAYAQKQAEKTQTTIVLVSDEDRAEGTKLGRDADLVNEILREVEKLGLVGEQNNKLMGYLVMTSRKLDDPLALLILSGSGAGKSLLQDTLLKLCPDEDLVKLTSLTDRALFYKGEHALQNKVLALEEVAGAEGAYYAIRNLISAKKLVIESTIKNPFTGTLTTQVNTVHGPTAVFQTTTRPDIDAETRSRFIITSVDESPEQTRAILEAQRKRHTLEGLRRKKLHEAIIKRHHAFQRLLKPLPVVNPFEPLLSYAEDRLAVRRDNPKYLNLILAVTFLHQMQRPVKHDAESGQDYIETTLSDIAIANQLATALFGQTLDELSRPSRELLKLIRKMVDGLERKERQAAGRLSAGSALARGALAGGATTTFNRRAVREFTGWSDYQVKIHIKQLEELEYLVPLSGRRGQSFCYRLAWEGEGLDGERFLPGLVSVEELRHKAEVVGLFTEQVGSKTEVGWLEKQVVGPKTKLEGSSRAQVGLPQNGANPRQHRKKSLSGQKLEGNNGAPVPLCEQGRQP
jgi:DNA primase catalytic core